MVQISLPAGTSLPVREGTGGGTARLVEAIRGSSSGRAFSGQDEGGAIVLSDRQHVAASGRFAVEAKARSVAASNAIAGASLLQSADDALSKIRVKLDQLTVLAQRASSDNLSDLERAQLDAQFQAIKSAIDTIAATAQFNGIPVLQGGDGADGALEIPYKVGTGAAPQDEIVASVAPASVADLSAGLADDSLSTQAGASTAGTDITEAIDAVGPIRAGIAGTRERFAAAYDNNRSMQQANDAVRDALTTPSVTIDLSRVLAERIAQQGGVSLTSPAADRFRQLLLAFNLRDTGPRSAPDEQSVSSNAPAAATGPADSQPAATTS